MLTCRVNDLAGIGVHLYTALVIWLVNVFRSINDQRKETGNEGKEDSAVAHLCGGRSCAGEHLSMGEGLVSIT